MKEKIITLVAILCIAANVSLAQGYTNSPSDSFVTTAGMDVLKVATISQFHSASDTLYLTWEKIAESIPAGWDVSLCDYAHCYTFLPATGTMDAVLPGDVGLMSLHVTPHINTGVAIIRYAIWDVNHASHKDTLTWVVSCVSAGIALPLKEDSGLYCFRKTIYVNNVNGSYNNLTVFDLAGKSVLSQPIGQGITTINAAYLNDGLYTIAVTGNNAREKIKIFLANQ